MTDIKIDNRFNVNQSNISQNQATSKDGRSFSDFLNDSIKEVNDLQNKKDEAMADMATGQVKDLHQAAIAINKAETSMKLMLEVRNKAISAYKEILRTQI
ncbi:MAG: flagellar hook-basal body complex protein FliE [Campylobacterales bacterium]|nr:flagellar hook-basal body complex protein FliE [Campylobacterales bacterium]